MYEKQSVDKYPILAQLGVGGQATVYLCYDDQKGREIAVKVYHNADADGIKYFENQVGIFGRLDHGYVVKCYGSKGQCEVKRVQSKISRPTIFMEYAQRGQLLNYFLGPNKNGFSHKTCRTLFKMLLTAIQHMHSKGVSHLDLTNKNILFDKKFTIKIQDFGHSALSQGPNKDYILDEYLGTDGFRPPQIEENSNRNYNGQKVDLFAAGVNLFYMYTGSLPFSSTNKVRNSAYKFIRINQVNRFWALHQRNKFYFSQSLKQLISSLLSVNPQERPNISKIRTNQWLCQSQATMEQVFIQLSARFKQLQQTMPQIKQIEQARRNDSLKNSFVIPVIKEVERFSTQGKAFEIVYKQLKLSNSTSQFGSIPLSSNSNLIPVKVKPSILIAQLELYIKKAEKQKNIFKKKSFQQINPLYYIFIYSEYLNKITIRLKFQVNQTGQPGAFQLEELYVEGNLVRIQGCGGISIEWVNKRGNIFWMASFINQLNCQLSRMK